MAKKTIKLISLNSGDYSVGIQGFEVFTTIELDDCFEESFYEEIIKHHKDFLNEMYEDCTRCYTYTLEEFEKMESEQEKWFTEGD